MMIDVVNGGGVGVGAKKTGSGGYIQRVQVYTHHHGMDHA